MFQYLPNQYYNKLKTNGTKTIVDVSYIKVGKGNKKFEIKLYKNKIKMSEECG